MNTMNCDLTVRSAERAEWTNNSTDREAGTHPNPLPIGWGEGEKHCAANNPLDESRG